MTDSRKVVKVFLASPGDLTEERKAAKAVVDEFNNQFADVFGYQVELVGWEDTVSVYGRPQATINRELERCELFVGLMWKKWGTPSDTTATYSSGFQEEFETTVLRREKEGRPEISLMFKDIDKEFLRDPGDDLKKVLAFKDKLIAEKKILFVSFADTREFEKKIRSCITKYVTGLWNQEAEEVFIQNQATKTGSESQKPAETNSATQETPLSIEGAKFLRDLISKAEHYTETEQMSTVEVARFRLLANIVGNQGNDDNSLGVHDANLLFAEGSNFTFGRRELVGLMSCGLEHYFHENAPLWRWYAAIDGFTNSILPIFSVIKSSTESKVGALSAMRLISEPLPSEQHESRKLYLESWFAKDMASAVKVAALNYLSDCGVTSDIQTINKEFDRSDYQTTSAAADAIIRINLRDSREKAILSLYELQPNSISPKVLATLFDNDAALSTETLLNGVDHRNPDVRGIIVELLCNRGKLPNETAEQLLTDSNAKVRYEALTSLVANGRKFSNEEAKKILVKKVEGRGLGLLAMGAAASGGDNFWSHFQLNHLRSLADKELEAAVTDFIFDRNPHFILVERQFKRRVEDLRKYVDNQYKDAFSLSLQKKIEQFGQEVELIEQIQSLEDYIRKELTRRGLDVICRKADPCDLGRVRQALKSGFIGYSTTDIEFLRKFGEWEDIALIIDLVKRPESGQDNTLLKMNDETKYRTAARAIYALGRTRLQEVLSMSVPDKLLSQLIIEIPDKAFHNLANASIHQLLRSEDDSVRKSTALKCIKALPKKHIAKILTDYVSGGQFRYYNVVHWLDFGVSTPRDRALLAAAKVLNKD